MELEVYALVILCSLTFHIVRVNAQSDFRDDTSGPKGNNLPWFTNDVNNFLFPIDFNFQLYANSWIILSSRI